MTLHAGRITYLKISNSKFYMLYEADSLFATSLLSLVICRFHDIVFPFFCLSSSSRVFDSYSKHIS
jgi:hypothetical protein